MGAIGVDFGTAFIRAAGMRGNAFELLGFPDALSIPTAVTIADAQRHHVVPGIKRWLGRCRGDAQADRLAAAVPCALGFRSDGGVLLRFDSKAVEPEALAATLLRRTREAAMLRLGHLPLTAVVGVPNWFDAAQHAALERSARMAGFLRVELIHEAMGTALACTAGLDGIVAVVDAGASSCTVSILQVGTAGVLLTASASDTEAGGDDVDRAILEWVLRALDISRESLAADADRRTAMLLGCQGAKHALSQPGAASAVVSCSSGPDNRSRRLTFTRETFDALLQSTVQRVRATCASALAEAGLGSDALSAVLCVGGMSRTPGIIQAVQSVLGPPSTLPLGHVGTVAVGSAMRAAVIDGSADGVPLVDARDRRRATIPPIPALDPLPAVSPGSTSADAEEEAAPEAADPFSDVYQSTAAMFESAMAAQQSPTNEHEQATAHPTAHPTPVVPFSNDPRVERVAAMCRHLLSLAEIPPKSLGVLEKALMPIEHDGFVGVAVGHIERAASRQLQSILVAYVERFADGHEHQLGRLLPCMGARDALRIIQMLATLRTAAGKRAIEQALASPLSVVRMQALSHLASTGEMAWEAVEPLLSDPDDDIRLQVIELIMERAYPRAGMALAARIRSDAYDKLSPSERFALLEALAAVHRKWARATAMDVLESARVFGSSAHAESRAIAADFLSRFDDPEVLGALERHASRRFTNRSAVRDSAARGADRIRRRSSRPPPR